MSQVCGEAGVCPAWSPVHAWNARILVQRVVRVQPKHVGLCVIPQGHDKHHTPIQGFSHGLQATLASKVINVSKGRLHCRTRLICHGVACHARNGDVGVWNDLAVLHVEASNVDEVSIVCVALGDELSDNLDLSSGVHSEAPAAPVVSLVTQAPMVVVTAVLVTDTIVALVLVVVTTLDALADIRSCGDARVRCVGRGTAVGLPDIHLRTANAPRSDGRVMAGIPADDVGLAVHELHVVGALRIAVARPVLCPGSIASSAASLATICIHFHEVHRAVEAARHLSHVRRQRELAVFELEELVGVLVIQHVDSRAKVVSVLCLCHKAKLDAVINGLDSVGAPVLL